MDWTMINNAEDAKGRIRSLYYLLSIRYESDPDEAGVLLRNESKTNSLCQQVIGELQEELKLVSEDLGMGTAFSDKDVQHT